MSLVVFTIPGEAEDKDGAIVLGMSTEDGDKLVLSTFVLLTSVFSTGVVVVVVDVVNCDILLFPRRLMLKEDMM